MHAGSLVANATSALFDMVARAGPTTVFILLALMAMTTSCASSQLIKNYDRIDELTPGESTTEDAVALLGEPQSVVPHAEGGKLLRWSKDSSLWDLEVDFSGREANVAILFDRDERMVQVVERSKGTDAGVTGLVGGALGAIAVLVGLSLAL